MRSRGRILLAQELSNVHRGLVAVHTVLCATRLLRIYEALAECNPRVLWSFTVPPDDYKAGVREFLAAMNIETIPWKQVVNELQVHFDVALAASWGGLHKLRIPVIKMAHGALYEKTTPRRAGAGAEMPRYRHGLSPERMMRDGRMVAFRTMLAHEDDLASLAPEAREHARVLGDPITDQIDEHLHLREWYRQELKIGPGVRLVVVTSTAGARCLWLDRPELLHRLVSELPTDRYRVMAVLHPNLRHAFGSQMDVALRRPLAAGLQLVPADQDWAVPLIAADWVVGDHGSVLHYASRTEAALLTAGFAHEEVAPGTARAQLGESVPELVLEQPLEPQLLAAARPEVVARYASAGDRLTSQPGRFAANLRREIHDLLGIAEPAVPARLPELAVPKLIAASPVGPT